MDGKKRYKGDFFLDSVSIYLLKVNDKNTSVNFEHI